MEGRGVFEEGESGCLVVHCAPLRPGEVAHVWDHHTVPPGFSALLLLLPWR